MAHINITDINLDKALFKVGDDIMNNEGVVYNIIEIQSWKTPPTPPGEEPMEGDDTLNGYIYIAKKYDGRVKRISIPIDTPDGSPNNNVDVNGMPWRKTIQRGGKKSKKSKKSMKKRKSKKSRKSKK